jgi:hypothetical protein
MILLLEVGKLLVARLVLASPDAWLTTERDAVLNAYLPGASHASYAGNTALFLSIHTADPGNTGASEYTTYTGTRPSIAFPAASSQSAGNTAQIDFAAMGATTITHVGLWTATSAGTFKGGGALAASKTTASGDTLRFVASTGVVVSLA